MSLVGSLNSKPPRISFTALKTGETFEFPYIPEGFDEAVVANYSEQEILGMSHKNLQYSNTENHSFEKLEFIFKAENERELDNIHKGRRFLLSLCYSYSDSSTVRNGAPSRVLFFWPQMVSMTCIIKSVNISHKQFNRTGKSVYFIAGIELREIRDRRLFADEVRRSGTIRSNYSTVSELGLSGGNNLELRDLPESFE